jgi:glycosyltransferase involved in cell wall biosynthesis
MTSSSRVRVLRVIARMNLGGPAHQASLLSGRRFDPERYETLLVHGQPAPGEESMADLAEREGATTVYLPSLRQPVNPLQDTRALVEIGRIARRFKPDLVHTHTAKAGFLGRQAALLALHPRPVLVHTFHGHVLEGYFGETKTRLYRGLERTLGRRTDRLIGVSRQTVEDLVRLGVAPREKFSVIPLGLELGPFAELDASAGQGLRGELGVGADETLFGFVGRIVPIKRLDLLIRAFTRARRNGANARLAVVGDGERLGDFERLAAELGIADAISFLGYRRDLNTIAAASDVAILSSDNEGTPVWLIEASAGGIPSIATNVGGTSDVVTPESGILVPPDDEVALAGAITQLSADRELQRRMGAAAKEHVLSRYSIERLLTDIDALYRELLEPAGAPEPVRT